MLIMMNNDAEMLCQVFILSSKFFGVDNDVKLKPGGKEIDVTNEYKYDFYHLVLKYRLF